MSKLKKLSSADLATISDDFGEILEIEVSKAISTKELDDLDLDIIVSYENNQLDVDVDVGVTFDKLSEITQDQVAGAIDEAYLKFDSYIDENIDNNFIFLILVNTFFNLYINIVILFYKKIFILQGLMYNIQFEVMFCIIH